MPETELTERESNPSTNGDNGPESTPGNLAERDSKGRFLPGNPGGPGNPQARNVATWRGALAASVSADDVAEVTRKLLEAARAGEPWAVKEFFDRCLGKPHVQIDLTADVDTVRQYSERERAEAKRIARILLAEGQENG